MFVCVKGGVCLLMRVCEYVYRERGVRDVTRFGMKLWNVEPWCDISLDNVGPKQSVLPNM